MALSVPCPPSSCSADPPAVPQRKRRRRAPASGAHDDCFACTKRNVKCDRRRPYCSQCLEVGKECSGYKTQLTWGVGVASRGKLRGLSLPVARSAPAPKSPPTYRPRASTTLTRQNDTHDAAVKIKMESMGTMPEMPMSTYDFASMASNPVTTPMHNMTEWNIAVTHDFPLRNYQQNATSQQRQLPQLQQRHTLSLGRGHGLGLSTSIDSTSSYAESEYAGSSMSQSFPDDVPYSHSPVPMYNSYSAQTSNINSPVVGMLGDSRGPTSCPDNYYAQSDMSSSLGSHQNQYDIHEARQQQHSPSIHELFFDDDILGATKGGNDIDMYATSTRYNHLDWNSINDEDATSQAASDHYPSNGTELTFSSYRSEISPRISFFLNYYEKIICPSVVAIDNASNPYREHILSLASSSRSLQHAICALAACNLRMKRKQSLGQDHWRQPLELEFQDRLNGGVLRPALSRSTSNNFRSPESPTSGSVLQEEFQHRSLAVQLLNQQLSSPSQARHDCVLATLFILCHYRMCESGVAQFRTQFAGVKKILGMRDSGSETGKWGWMETLFTYFDGIAASINDREAQLRGNYLEMIANPSNPNHALENLTGCDSILFKTIGKLGRLNMLCQHRAVHDDWPQSLPVLRPAPPRPRPGLAGQALVDFYSQHAHNFDGNGFASTLDDEASLPHLASQTSRDDLRTTFWAEWKAARLSLQEWEFDPTRIVATLPTTPSPTQLRDFGYISEAFRYAALLYTERLACPNLPSSHLTIQNLVSQVLFYVTSLEPGSGCEKFLPWPLFISGSECINELQQSIVRNKCREIMGKSGYLNNLAGLEVLEKLWKEKGVGGSEERGGSFGAPFRWTRFMEGGREWIMV